MAALRRCAQALALLPIYMVAVLTGARPFSQEAYGYDERGVELVWHLQRALYGGPDSGRVWYNTFAHFLMKEDQITPFQRCHHEPCTFTHFLDGQTDANGAPKRIICSVYVDDGAAHVG